jgi:hypothetical protein
LNSILPERDQQILVQQILNDLAKLTRKKDEELRSRLLLQLMPYVKELGVPDQIEKAVRQIRSFRTPEWRTRLLGHMVKLVPQQEQRDLLAEVFRDYVEISFSDDQAKALQPYILDAIAQNLPPGAISPALDSAFSVEHLDEGRERSEILDSKRDLLKDLSVHVPDRVADDFFEACLEFIWHTSFTNAVMIALAPKLSKQSIKRASSELAPEAKRHGLYGHLRFSHDRPRNILITSLIALAHFCQDPALKEEIGEEIEEILDEIPDGQRRGKYEIKYRTIATLYEITFDRCSDDEAARLVYEDKIEIGAYGRGSQLFCILGPKTMKAAVDKLNQKHDLGGRSVGISVRSSPYFLSRVAEQLADRDLNLVMEIAGEGEYRDYEKWGRMRAISKVADRASSIQRQRFLDYIVKDGPTAWCYDSRLEALRSLASSMSFEFAKNLVWTEDIPIGRRSMWARWMLPESFVDRLHGNVIQELTQVIREKLEIWYNADLAQSLVVLAANTEKKERLGTWDFIKRQSSFFITDIPKQTEAIEMLLWHLQGEQSRRWRASIRQQAREIIRRFDASLFRYGKDRTELVDNRPGVSLYRPAILKYLSFGERFRRTYDLRKKGYPQANSYHPLVWSVFSLWIAVTESISLRKLVRLIFFVGWGLYLWVAKLMPDWAKQFWGHPHDQGNRM